MVEKPYEWLDGAVLDDHSKRKHKILREYLGRYLEVRCQLPQRERFRLAIVDGFAGGGRYKCGSPGSPLIFVQELKMSVLSENIRRAAQGMKVLQVEVLLALNDASPDAIEMLKINLAPLLEEVKQTVPQLHVRLAYSSELFETAYPKLKRLLEEGRFRNVVFNLDQCGHRWVERNTLLNILHSYQNAEIFYTFAIESLLTYLRASDPTALAAQLAHIGLSESELRTLEGRMNKQAWLGVAEKLVFDAFSGCAPYVSPFSINNPGGWRYWLIHFANSYRGRQEYNNILHRNSSAQAHFGRSGLDMLAYDPAQDNGTLYLFDDVGRANAKNQLMEDIPRLVSEFGDAIGVGGFYEAIYNSTPAHMDDIHEAIIENNDLVVITESGGERRKAGTIIVGDTIRLKKQRSMFPMFPGHKK
jgi:three-Cys-motif partner protein